MSDTMVDRAYLELIRSDRVSARTRQVLLSRAEPAVAGSSDQILSDEDGDVLSAVIDRILPRADDRSVDLAARVQAELTSGAGDGWRFAALPSDLEAWRDGLKALEAAARSSHGSGFKTLDSLTQDALLQTAAEGALDAGVGLDAARLRLWFEDLRAAAVKQYVAHPAVLARIGYSGIAYGGDCERKQGFHALGPGEREDWEPRALTGGPS